MDFLDRKILRPNLIDERLVVSSRLKSVKRIPNIVSYQHIRWKVAE